ncbi:MAG: type II 3-dehydroquinate dehydratase [Proteobacteria bacterium]|nr:type II 3-dehydroquinate dehydratase [Pseudomonadota bacterium]
MAALEPTLRVLVLHGPNLNLLGTREPEHYGNRSLAEIDGRLAELGAALGCHVDCRQSNHEGQLIDWIQQARGQHSGLVINPGGFTHTSVALRDAISACGLPSVEVHISNTQRRERFRQRSLTAPVCVGSVVGFGPGAYSLGLRGLIDYLKALPAGSSP